MNREQWLTEAATLLRPDFDEAGYPLPTEEGDYLISVGWPSRSGLSASRRVIGECWGQQASKVAHVFVSPLLVEPVKVLGTLAHELAHVVTPGAGHRSPFTRVVKALGLEGKPTHTTPGEAFTRRAEEIVEKLGAYPHTGLVATPKTRVQTTRMLKVECQNDGYTVRTTAKWLEYGEPICPICNEQMYHQQAS